MCHTKLGYLEKTQEFFLWLNYYSQTHKYIREHSPAQATAPPSDTKGLPQVTTRPVLRYSETAQQALSGSA
jgi:hypothetical protein